MGRNSKKDRQYNGQNKDKHTKEDLQNTTEKTKDWAKRTPLKHGSERYSVPVRLVVNAGKWNWFVISRI